MLCANVHRWAGEEPWHTHIELTEPDAAFPAHKADLSIYGGRAP